MKKFITIVIGIALFATSLTTNAQNGNGTPAYCLCGGLVVTPEIESELANIPLLKITPSSRALSLPNRVDNSERPWFRDIFLQTDGCCGQAAGVGYTFTYEVNRIRNLEANTIENLYPTHFTYNFTNEIDTNRGSWPHHGWEVIKQMGVPTVQDYGGMFKNMTSPNRINVWETGYEHYYHALTNKVVLSYEKEILIDSAKINNIKRWLHNHGNGEASGGLGVFCANIIGFNYAILPPESASAGQWVVTGWGSDPRGRHAMTIVGYDDNIMYDFDNDGQFTNSGNVSQWERGAFIVANSWGSYAHHNNGFLYVPYRLATGFCNKEVYCLTVTDSYSPEIVLKVKVKHPSRARLKFHADYASNAYLPGIEADIAYAALNWYKKPVPMFYNLAMQGLQNNNDPIEMGLDFGQFFKEQLDNNEIGKVFFVVKESGDALGQYDGEIRDFSLIDYRWNEVFELPYPGPSIVPIVNDGDTRLGIPYHLLPFEQPIMENMTLATDRVARREVTVVNHSTLTINDGVGLDMYGTEAHDCKLLVESGSSLVINDNAIITAKRGDCEIVVNGNVQIGQGVRFRAENGATLRVSINGQQEITIRDCQFVNTSLQINAPMERSVSFPSTSSVTVSNCTFRTTTGLYEHAMRIDGYSNIMIADNTIDGTGIMSSRHFDYGIMLFNCGTAGLGSLVLRNTIKGCNETGLTMYGTAANVKRNEVTQCRIGVGLLNGSTVSEFTGNCGALSPSHTQHIHDNDECEVYIYRDCLPQTFRYNRITGSGNSWLVEYENNVDDGEGLCIRIDLEHNNWGSLTNTQVENRFHYVTNTNNVAVFDYLPKWTLGECVNIGTEMAVRMSREADSLLGIGLYSSAKASYRDIVELYPNTTTACNAMKKLLIAETLFGEDYVSLQQYYRSETAIQEHESLEALAGGLANKCDEMLERYEEAIAWYETIIQDEETPYNDSIFATIDLGNLYLKMEANGAKGLKGKLAQFVPKSAEAFAKQTNEALRKLKTYPSRPNPSRELPDQYWVDIVTEQPEGYVVDGNGDVHLHSAEALAWLISTVNGLNGQEADNFDGKKVTLEANVDMSEALWVPIADGTNLGDPNPDRLKFCGTFDGNGFEINRLCQYSPYMGSFSSFFGHLCGATIKNVVMKQVYAAGRSDRDGLFFANADAQTLIDRCYFEVDEVYKSDMNEDYSIFGYNNEGVIRNCITRIKKVDYQGNHGINMDMFMRYNNGTIQNCASVADSLKWLYSYGGMAGTNNGLIENCYSYIGSFFGDYEIWWPPAPRQGMCMDNLGTIKNCYYNSLNADYWIVDNAAYVNYGTIEQTFPFVWNNGWELADSLSVQENNLLKVLNAWVEQQDNKGNYSQWCIDESVLPNGLPVLSWFADILSVEENEVSSDCISIYPNPAEGKLTIDGFEVAEVQVCNALGQMLRSSKGNAISVSGLTQGLYLLRITDEKGATATRKIIVK